MKWYKHMSDMIDDPKIRRIIRKHGAEGYAVYNLVLERITKRIEKESPLPDLEETSSDIAEYLRMDTVHVEEIMHCCMSEGLFEQHEMTGRILCTKLYKFLEQSSTRSGEIRDLIAEYKAKTGVSDCPRLSETVRDNPDRREENRREEKRREPRSRAKDVHEETGKPINLTTYKRLCKKYGQVAVDKYIRKVSAHAEATGHRYKDYASAAEKWMIDDDVTEQKKSQAEACPHCGATVQPGMDYCRNCREQL